MEEETGNKTTLFLGLRKPNGQIGYLSESLSIPEFFEMVRPVDHQTNVLIDFFPIIETLHALHKDAADKAVITKYKSMYNYWHDSITYRNLQVRLSKSENLCLAASDLMSILEDRIEKHSLDYRRRKPNKSNESLDIIKELEKDTNIFIDTLLCFIHSKASLEIESFKGEVMLGEYCNGLLSVLKNLLVKAVDYSTYNEKNELESDSLLFHLAIVDQNAVNSYSQLLPNYSNREDLRLVLLRRGTTRSIWGERDESCVEILTRYRVPDHDELTIARILRDLCYKVISVAKLISTLKHEVVQWDPSDHSIEELKSLILPLPPITGT